MTISLDLTLIGTTAVVRCECCEITQQCTYIKDHDTRWSEGYPNGLRPVAVAVCEGCKSHEFSCVPEEEEAEGNECEGYSDAALDQLYEQRVI